MARWVIIILVLSCLSCASKDEEDHNLADLHLRIGTGYLQKGDYPRALRELLVAEKLNPQSPIIQNNLGLAFFFRERNDMAIIHLRKAISLRPKYTEARNNLGRVYIELKKYRAAIKHLQLVLADLTYPSPEKGQLNIGLAYFHLRDYDRALSYFTKAISTKPTFCLAYNFYGRTLFELKRFRKAAESLDRAVQICQRQRVDEPHYYSGLSYMKLGNREKAVARLREVVKLYPNGKYREDAQSMLKVLQ